MAKGLTAAKAKKILEDGKVRGKALTEKQKKFFGAVAGGATPLKKLNGGWLDKFDNGGVQPNYNDSNVSLPPGFKGYGYDKGGRAYNGAWDGPVTRMGGTIPGATGMMYARTSGTSPEEPKKAQYGREIVRDNTSVRMPKIPSKVDLFAPRRSKTDEEIAAERKAIREKSNDNVLNQYSMELFNPDNWTRENLSESAAGLESMFRVSDKPNFFDDWLNPLNMIGSMASSLGQAPLQAEQSDSYLPYVTSVGLPLTVGALGGIGAKSTGQFVNNIANPIPGLNVLPKAKNFKEVLGAVGGIPPERSLARLSPEELKVFRKVQEIGRMRATNKPISEQYRYALDQGIPDDHFFRVFNKTKEEVKNILSDLPSQEIADAMRRSSINLQRPPRRRPPTPDLTLNIQNASAEEMQRFAENMGMTSEELFSRSQSRDSFIRHNLEDYADEQLPTINSSVVDAILNSRRSAGSNVLPSKKSIDEIISNKFENIISEYPVYRGPVLQNVPSLHLSGSGSLKNVSKQVGDQSASGISSGDVFTGSLNTSHSSYLPQLKQVFKYTEGSPQFLGYNPMNDLGFLSNYNYSASDIAKYLNTEIDTQIKRGIIPNNIQRPFVKKNSVILPHYGIKQFQEGGWLDKFQEGGVIEDDRGQWAYPGEITKINSNNITMKGVNYPVLGISDTGDKKMMQPGKDYKFKGNSVTEFPMAQKGMNVEGQKQKKWFDSYIRSDKYLERLRKEFPEMNADELANERWARLMNMRSTPIGFLPESSEISPTPDSTQGVYDPEEKKIMLRPEYSEGRQGPWSYNTIPLHELGHALDEGGKRIPQTTLDFLMPKLKQNPYDIPKETFYYTDPTEYINRLQPFRYLLQEEGIYDAKKKDFTKEDLQKAKENTRIKYNRHFKDLMENTESEEDLIEIMNTIAARPQMQQDTMVAKDGKSLVELNQLTNFTNYNTPQPGGWLDKYH